MTEPVVTLELTVPEVNLILAGLAELPFKLSSNLLVKVKGQADEQLQPPPRPTLVPDDAAATP